MKLYKHQKKQNKAAAKSLKEHDHVLYGAATGFGKSVVLADMIRKDFEAGLRVLVIAPFRKLVFQLEKRFEAHRPHVIMGTINHGDPNSDLILTSLDTLNSRLRRGFDDYDNIDRIYWDEVHISGNMPPKEGSRMLRLYDKYWGKVKWVGFTATPITPAGWRLPGWDDTVYLYQTADLIEMGYLADYDYYAPEVMDLNGMQISSATGDYLLEEIEERVMTASAIKSVKRAYKKFGEGKKTLLFAASISHAQLIQKELGGYIVHSKMGEKEQIDVLGAFEKEAKGLLINVAMLTTGFDDPAVEVLIITRPIKSLRLAIQVWGRVLRAYDTKRATIVDMASVYQNCGTPRDKRDFNRIKPKTQSKQPDTIPAIRCPHCKNVIATLNIKRKMKYKKKYILKRLFCPICEEMIDEIRTDLTDVKKLVKIGESTGRVYSFKERKEVVCELVDQLTGANPKWGHYIVQTIKDKVALDALIEKRRIGYWTDRTIWKKIMELYDEARTAAE